MVVPLPFLLGLTILVCRVPLSSSDVDLREAEDRSHRRMIEALDRVALETSETNDYLGTKKLRGLRAQLKALTAEASPRERWSLLVQLGEAQLKLGREDAAVNSFTTAYTMLPEVNQDIQLEEFLFLALRTGVAFLRVAETQNCCLRYSPESCVLPIEGKGIHTVTEPSRRAKQFFLVVLKRAPKNSPEYLRAQWLLNLAQMTLGEYPDKVAEEYRIPETAFGSPASMPRFSNISQQLGLDTVSLAGGVIAEDFDNDGDLDLLVSSWEPSAQIQWFRNEGDGTFQNRTLEAGLEGIRGGLNLIHGDYDNDGDVDAVVLRGAWLGEHGRHPNSLLRNRGDGTFVDVAHLAGLGEAHYPTQTGAFADYDNDGDLDLYLGNEHFDEMDAPCQLFQNQGDGTFLDVAEHAGVANRRFAKGTCFGDYDADGHPDLYVSNLGGPNRLYHNNGDGTFTDVAEEAGVTHPLWSFPAWFWDYDNDGHLDLFVTAYIARIEHHAASLLGIPHQVEMARLYRGDGSGGFQERAADLSLTRPTAPMGSNFGDLDGDGYLDFYLGTGYPDYQELTPNTMYLNQTGKKFVDVTTMGRFGHLQKGHGVAFADLDNDGDLDVFEQMGGAYSGDRFADALYLNPGFGNDWLSVRLRGKTSNRSAIGARLQLQLSGGDHSRSIHRRINSGGSFGANPFAQYLAFQSNETIDQLVIDWPTSGTTQVFTDVPRNAFVTIEEHAETLRLEDFPSFGFADQH